MDWQTHYAQALPYQDFLDRYATPAQRGRWEAVYDRVALTPAQQEVLRGFVRRMHLLCLAGAWCGDCILQGPVLQRLTEGTSSLTVRFLDRDDHPAVQDALMLNAGRRVPVVVFLSEDFHECGRFGDRTLSMYRKMARDRLGAACPAGVVPPGPDLLAEVTADWLRELERVQLLLRLSPRLRARHAD